MDQLSIVRCEKEEKIESPSSTFETPHVIASEALGPMKYDPAAGGGWSTEYTTSEIGYLRPRYILQHKTQPLSGRNFCFMA